MEKILAVIPARGGSKTVPRKNIKLLCERPLIQYIFETARQSKYIDRIIVSTDDSEIASVARSMDLEVPFMRPAELATDTATSISVIKHALKFFDMKGKHFDAVISLQATNPFTSVTTIDNAIEIMFNSRPTCVTAVAEATQHPYITKRLKSNNRIESFCVIPAGIDIGRRQNREKAYYMTGALYLRPRSTIEAENLAEHYLGSDPAAIVVNELEAIDINNEFDFELARWLMQSRLGK